MPDPFIQTAIAADAERCLAALTLAFSGDPPCRWAWPDVCDDQNVPAYLEATAFSSGLARSPNFKFLFNLNVRKCMSPDHAFFRYQAKITNAGHAESEGEPVHCMIRVKRTDEQGRRQRNVDVEQQAGDKYSFRS